MEGIKLKERIRIACHHSTMRNSLKYAIIVGPLQGSDMLKIGLTMIVPYLVATFSSVSTVFKMRSHH
jgi:hypothetical protein